MKFLIAILVAISSTFGFATEKTDILIVGTCADNPPFEFADKDLIKGFDIDLIKEVARILGKKVELKNMSFSSLIHSLTTRKVDLVIAGLSATEKRSKYVTFSDSYIESSISLLLKKDFKVSSLQDLENCTIGAQLGSTWQAVAIDLSKQINNLQVKPLLNNLVLVEELKLGKVDAVVLETPQVVAFLKKDPQLGRFHIPDTSKPLSMVFRKDDPLALQVNAAIAQLKNANVIDSLAQKWLK